MSCCRICGAPLNNSNQVISFREIPFKTCLVSTAEEALSVERGDIELFWCGQCGLIQQREALPLEKLYNDANYIGNWRFQPHMSEQLDFLKKHTQFTSCLEIGSGNGQFLKALKEQTGIKKALGLEANQNTVSAALADGIFTIHGIMNEEKALEIKKEWGYFDVIVARHVLEHMPDLKSFFHFADILLDDQGCIFAEVPNFTPLHTHTEYAYTFASHEHVTLFTAPTLALMFQIYGYGRQHLYSDYRGGGVLNILASKGVRAASLSHSLYQKPPSRPSLAAITQFSDELRRLAEEAAGMGQSIALYGAGSHGLMLLHMCPLFDLVDVVLDDIPGKHGLFLPGCDRSIIPVKSVKDHPADTFVVLALHPEWEEAAIERLSNHRSGPMTIVPVLSRRAKIYLKS